MTQNQNDAAFFGEDAPERAVLGKIDADGGECSAAFAFCFFNFSAFVAKKGLCSKIFSSRLNTAAGTTSGAMMSRIAAEAARLDCVCFERTVLDWN